MNLERGFPVPMEKRDVWAPVTPEKPAEQRPNQFPAVGTQQNQKQDESWQDLLGIYTGFLQDESCGGVVDVIPTEPTIRNVSQNVRPLTSSSSAGLDGVNHWNGGRQDASRVDKFGSFDQNYGNAGSYLQNSGDLVTPPKVSSLAELMGIESDALNAPAMQKASFISQGSGVERSCNNCTNQDIGGYNLQHMPSSKQIFIDRFAVSFFTLKL